MQIKGIEGMTFNDVNYQVQNGAKFVIFQYCISILIMTFRRPSNVYFIPSGESAWTKSLPFCLISLVLGWWGFPWGLIYTPGSLITNLSGGKDVTGEIMAHFASGSQDYSDIEQEFSN